MTEPTTPAGRALLRANTGVWGATHRKDGREVVGIRDAILAIEEQARAEGRREAARLDVDTLAHAFQWVRDPNDPLRTVIPTGYTTLLSSEVPAIRRRQAELVLRFIEESGVARHGRSSDPTEADDE